MVTFSLGRKYHCITLPKRIVCAIFLYLAFGDLKPLKVMLTYIRHKLTHKTLLLNYIEACAKWPPFRRRYFQMYFSKRRLTYFDSNFTESCSVESKLNGWCSGLARNRWQAITWTSDDPIHGGICASSSINELTYIVTAVLDTELYLLLNCPCWYISCQRNATVLTHCGQVAPYAWHRWS